MDWTNPIIVMSYGFGMLLNLVFSGGTLMKLISFAKEWGILNEKVRANSEEIDRLREDHDRVLHSMSEGRR